MLSKDELAEQEVDAYLTSQESDMIVLLEALVNIDSSSMEEVRIRRIFRGEMWRNGVSWRRKRARYTRNYLVICHQNAGDRKVMSVFRMGTDEINRPPMVKSEQTMDLLEMIQAVRNKISYLKQAAGSPIYQALTGLQGS